MPVERLRFSEQGRNRLITLKRRTGLPTWAVLSRLALCRSLADPSIPPQTPERADSTLEIDWRTLAGPYGDVLWGMLRLRCRRDALPLDEDTVARQLSIHVHRGLGYLVGNPDLKSIVDLAALTRTELAVLDNGTEAVGAD
ncbi:DNA sulfur modification protein DndE [Nonomuraea sp. NPDC046802]|uniref:DNA sulfur modification protein DndE n=1 Tax=Nonomuraea sp. NPDC046802 TaxID=3154919 RepID=UPI0033D744F7